MRFIKISLGLLLLNASFVFATVIYVPDNYPTIQAAVNAAQPGDTIQVDYGEYSTVFASNLDDISLFGSGMIGLNRTIINGQGAIDVSGITLNYCEGWVINGFEIYNCFQGVRLYYSSNIEVSNTYAHDNNQSYSVGVSMEGCQNINYHHNIVESNFYSGIWALNSNTIELINNTVVNNAGLFWGANGILLASYIPNLEIINNIVAFNAAEGIEAVDYQTGTIANYNDVYGNGGAQWYNVPIGVGNISSDPLFTYSPSSLYSLLPNSPCIDAGDPTIFDPDGTRSDIGALYFDQGGTGILTIDLIPQNPPIIIPPQGGAVNYDIQVSCVNGYSLFDGWTGLEIPDGQIIMPLILKESVYISSGATIQRSMIMQMPAYAQSGEYELSGYVGEFPDTVESQDSFTFTKLPYAGPYNGGPVQWSISGWGETEYFTTPGEVPEQLSLNLGISPNPFNPVTTINYYLEGAGQVEVKAFDVQGRLVAGIFSGFQPSGEKSLIWNADNLPSGIYFIQINACNLNSVKEVLLMK